ncbi:DUF4870 domain-containing protein [Paractinoplanes durhamensis]|uniref:DUF4870 domain-containing protein n=1 Tax=Paractinoplanes durhamensis TaxID=113563 RepID=A0ABQ3Z8B2_9ACTN|nr:DUF4870 domain-containing protein [Actinoplanes durhamensis]GIE06077.1 hypothetical protein Adu01nite_74270 [Actinoplanes durhamensis]
MTEPPRPPGEGNGNDPTAPFNPYAANDPAAGSTPPPADPTPPPAPPGGYAPPPTSGGGYAPPPGGYNPPPSSGGGYGPPPGGYNPPPQQQQYGYGAPQATGPDDRTWVLIAHFGGALGAFLGGGLAGWIAPLIAFLARGPQSPVVRAEAVKALNFQVLWSIIALVGWITTCIVIGFFVWIAAMIVGIVFGIIAGVKASNNEGYNYPMTVSLIK